MDFIYDILINFNGEEVYQYYEWYQDDDIKYIKKIPLFKLSNEDYINIKNNNIIIEKTFLDLIYNIGEIRINNKIKRIAYLCLFSNGKEVIALKFNIKGELIMKGGLLLDESYDVLNKSSSIKCISIKYEIITSKNINYFLTRYERKCLSFLLEEINKFHYQGKHETLRYLYYECFGETNEDDDKILKRLKSFIIDDWTIKHNYLYSLIKLFYKKEVMSKNP